MKKQMIVLAMTVALLLLTVPAVFAEVAPPATEETTTEVTQETVNATSQGTASATMADSQKLDASYTLALNDINKEDYETAKQYLDICFAYCDAQSNPVMYSDLLLKRACITELFTEERQRGKAYFRAGRIGDISHLTMAGLKPSFASRFCEVYSNMEQRH